MGWLEMVSQLGFQLLRPGFELVCLGPGRAFPEGHSYLHIGPLFLGPYIKPILVTTQAPRNLLSLDIHWPEGLVRSEYNFLASTA